MHPSLRLALLAPLLLAACDAAAPAPPNPPPDPGAPTLTVVRPLADTVVFVGSPRWLPLEERFRHREGAPLTYTARSDGDALAVHVSDYDYLVLEPRAPGTAAVIVEARAADGTSAADTLAVEVRPACPPAPEPGARDYFPLEAGRTWDFAGALVTTYSAHTNSIAITATLTVAEAECRGGEVEYVLRGTSSESGSRPEYDLTERFDHDLFFEPAFLHPDAFPRYAAAADTLDGTAFLEPFVRFACDMYWSQSQTLEALFVAEVGPARMVRQQPVDHPDHGEGTRTCRLALMP